MKAIEKKGGVKNLQELFKNLSTNWISLCIETWSQFIKKVDQILFAATKDQLFPV